MDRLVTLIEPVLYGDVFDFPVTLAEAHRFCRVRISRADLQRELEDERGAGRVVSRVGEYYVLRGREGLVAERTRRQAASRRSWRAARAVMGIVKYVPFVRGSLLTGSAAAGSATDRDDLDYLVLVSPGRLWMVFAVLGTLQRLGLRRLLCVNYYLSLEHLEIDGRSPYAARELLQARPLAGAEAVGELLKVNDWVAEVFPNARSTRSTIGEEVTDERSGAARTLSGLAERLLAGSAGDRLESLLRRLLDRRLQAHYRKHGRPVPAKVRRLARQGKELRFHANDYQPVIAAELEQRIRSVRQRVAAATEEPATSEGPVSPARS